MILGQDFESQLEDIVFCNNRSIKWSSSQSYIKTSAPNNYYMYFDYNNNTYGYTCTNDTDKFSTTNTNAQLPYKV